MKLLSRIGILGMFLFAGMFSKGAPGDVKWTFQTQNAVRSSPALGANGLVYFGSMDGNAYAVEAATGVKRWETNLGSAIYSSPAIASNGTVIICSGHSLVALNGTNGGRKWEVGGMGEVYSSPAISPGGLVYFTSKEAYLSAVDLVSGVEKWSTYFPDSRQTYASPVVGANGIVYCGSGEGTSWLQSSNFWAFDAKTGKEKWSFRSVNMIQATPAIGADGTVYIPSYDKVIYAFEGQTGKKKWSRLLGDSISSSPAIGPDGGLYVGANDGRLYALNATDGSVRWSFLAGDTIHSSPALGADGTVYFGSYDKKFYTLDARTGRVKWSFTTGGLILSSPAISDDGVVYVGSMDGKLYAFEGSAPPAISAWPSFKGGLQRRSTAVAETTAALTRVVGLSVSSTNAIVSVQTTLGQAHHLESRESFDTGEWVEAFMFTGSGWEEDFSDSQPTAGQRFYRLRLEP
jgi:outer membrane protein assembly factor BamB